MYALSALALSLAGIYAVIAYVARLKEREFAIQAAMGAHPLRLIRLVFRQGLAISLLGLALGAAGAFFLTGFLKSWLFNVHPDDGLVFLLSALSIFVVTLLACWRPAQRAASVNPAAALKVQ